MKGELKLPRRPFWSKRIEVDTKNLWLPRGGNETGVRACLWRRFWGTGSLCWHGIDTFSEMVADKDVQPHPGLGVDTAHGEVEAIHVEGGEGLLPPDLSLKLRQPHSENPLWLERSG